MMSAKPNPTAKQDYAPWAARLREFVGRHRALADAAPDEATRKHHLRCALMCENEAETYEDWAKHPARQALAATVPLLQDRGMAAGLTVGEQLQRHYAQFEEIACDKGVRFYDEHQAPGQPAEDWHMELVVRMRVEFERRRVALQKERFWHFFDDDQPLAAAELSRPCEGCVKIREATA